MSFRGWCAIWAAALLVSSVSCYRATGVARDQVSAFQVTPDNIDLLPSGLDASGRTGDYILQSSNLQLVFDGDLSTRNRTYFGVQSGGGIIDVSTRYVDIFSRIQTRADDGIDLITQGVNLNPGTPIRYQQLEVEEIDEVNAGIILTGSIYDLDGSLRAQGAPVDQATQRVLDCRVTTELMLIDSVETETDSAEPVHYVTLTSVVENFSSVDLPIFSVHDNVITTSGATDIFVPYPGFGFSRALAAAGVSDPAYPPYVTLTAVQADAAHYAWISQTDALLSAAISMDAGRGLDHTFIGKVGSPGEMLPPGGALTFIREVFVFSSSYTVEQIYDQFVAMLIDSDSPLNIYANYGEFRAAFTFENAPGGQLQLQVIDQANIVYDGVSFRPVSPDNPFPIFGYRELDPFVSLYLPAGQLALQLDLANTPSELRSVATSEVTNEDGNEVLFERPIILEEDGLFDFGLASMADQHYACQLAIANESDRRLFGRFRVLPQNGSGTLTLGSTPENVQGDIGYVASNTQTFYVPDGSYRVYLSRGPLHNVNIIDVDVVSSVGEDGENTTFLTPGTVQARMEPALDWPGYLSADFGVRSANDFYSMVAKDDLVLYAAAEDLDVLFFSDITSEPTIEVTFESVATLQGAFNEEDKDNNIDSLLDEMAVSRCAATLGTPTAELEHGRGMFAMLNLPGEDEVTHLHLPIIESDPPEFFDSVRQIDPDVLICVMRPRAPLAQKIGLFSAIAAYLGLQPNQPIPADNAFLTRPAENGSATRWSDFDLVQLLPGNLYDEYLLARSDWFELLNGGIFKPATGGSIGGQTRDLPVGVVRTWIQVADTTLRDNDLTEFWSQVAAGHMFVSNGPLIDMRVGTAGLGETASVGSQFDLDVRVLAAPWIPVPQLRVVLDGNVIQTIPLSGEAQSETIRFDRQIPIEVAAPGDHWILVETGASLENLADPTHASSIGTFGIVNPGHLPLAFTNPIFLNVSAR